MEGARRVELKTFDKPKPLEKPKVAQPKPLKLAVRFEIKLEPSTDEKCPEISYTDLLLKHEKKRKRSNSVSKSSGLTTDDLFGDKDEDNLEALAKRMEDKYGKAYGTSRTKFIDLGDGYDTEDSFIDNEEAYDELVPSTLTTKHGGFYINCGVLDFKEVSDDEILSEEEVRKTLKKKNKRAMISSDSDCDEENAGKPAEPVKKKKKKKTLSTGSQDSAESRKSLLVKKKKKPLTKEEADRERLKKKKLLQKKKLVERAQLTLSEKELKQKSRLYDSIIDDVINSNNNAPASSLQPSQPGPAPAASTPVTSAPAAESETDGAKPKDAKETKTENKEPPKLPDNLSDKCISFINDLKMRAAKCTEEKSKFFNAEVNLKLISLDTEVRLIPSVVTRNTVYSHLSSFLPINRETLMKRMKLLRQKELSEKLQGPIDKLKKAINEVMPAQIEKYNTELQARTASKQEGQEKTADDSQDSDEEGVFITQPTSNTSVTAPEATSTGDEKKKEKSSAPVFRKKFEWSDGIRSCLCDVITVKMSSFDVLKVKGQTAEEFIKEFLQNEIISLWPKGWMQSRVLYKESKSAHVKWTNPTQQTAKPTVVKKPTLIANAMKMAASISNTSKSTSQQAQHKSSESLLSRAITSTSSKFTVSTVQDMGGKNIISGGDNHQQSILSSISTSVDVDGQMSNKSMSRPLSVTMPESASKSQQSLLKPRVVTITTETSSTASKNTQGQQRTIMSSSDAKQLLHGTKVKTTESGEKLVMDGEKVIGKLVLSPARSASTSSTAKNERSSAPSTPVTERKEVITITDSPFIDPTEHTESKTVPTATLKPSGAQTVNSRPSTSLLKSSSSTTSKASTSSTSVSDEDIKMITLPESQSNKHTVSIAIPAKAGSSSSDSMVAQQQANRRNFAAKRQKMVAQNQQAAANAVLQTAQVLQQQHLAASIVSQQAMLQHKKLAEDLICQQKIAKQQQIAAIVKEQKVQANIAAHTRLVQHQKIANQQKQQALIQNAKQQMAQQRLAAAQQQMVNKQNTVLYSPRSSSTNISSPPTRASTPSSQTINTSALASSPCRYTYYGRAPLQSALPVRMPAPYPYTVGQSPSTHQAAASPRATPSTQTGSPGLTLSWPSGLQQPSLSPAQIAAEYRRTLEVRRQLENMKK